MARYLKSFHTFGMDGGKFDAVIVGGGLAGLFCALRLPARLKIAVLCKKKLEDCDSYLAQGGIAASLAGDDRRLHVKDTMTAGCGVNDPRAVEILVDESDAAVRSLVELGVPFDRAPDGSFRRSLEGGHSVKRILHVDGDATGKGIMTALMADCRGRANITVLEDTFAVDLVTDAGRCVGVLAEKAGRFLFYAAPAVAMATGGVGQLFPTTTNSVVLTGDGIAMASRAGAALDGMEFVQFHPTALYTGRKAERAFLISEAVRGEGALLRSKDGERFMPRYDKRRELAPRDIVARAIFDQMQRTGSPCVYLDITAKDRTFLEKRFPTIFGECLKNGIDISKDWIPVAPCEHYFMGGIRTDYHGRTSIPGLYAVGECASTGVHGANRLASNSLLEAVVFGARAAADIAGQSISGREAQPAVPADCGDAEVRTVRLPDPAQLRENLRRILMADAGILRTRRGLEQALAAITQMQQTVIGPAVLTARAEFEIADMFETARLIVAAAAAAPRSIGSHFVVDAPAACGVR